MNVYDFDKTIFSGDCEDYFFEWFFKKYKWPLYHLNYKFYELLFKCRLIGKTRSREKEYRFLRKVEDLDQVLETYWDAHARHMMAWYLAVKEPTDVIATGSPRFLMEPMVRRLGLTELVATDMDRHTGRINGEFAVKQHKLEAFARHYRPEDIDWNSLAALGVQREQIEGNGMLDQMLRGFQTDKTVRVHFHFDGISHSNDSQLSLTPGTDGRLTVCSHGILDPEKMQKQFFGYDITDSDKQVLRQTGNMGHPATVTNRAGEQVEALVSRNLKTNELVAFPLSKVNIPAEKNGHTFTPDEIARLKQGEAVVCQFLSRAKEGEQPKLYPAPVQFSAAKMQIEFLFGDRGRLAMDAYKANLKQTANQEVPKTFRKQELTEKSRLELEAGGTVKVSGLVDKKGKAYQGYITWKPGEKPAFMFPKDYKAALEEGRVKPAVENEVQVAVNSEGKTVEATRNLKEALQSAQQRPTGEQKQQQERRQEQKEDRKQEQKQEQPDKPKRSRGVRR